MKLFRYLQFPFLTENVIGQGHRPGLDLGVGLNLGLNLLFTDLDLDQEAVTGYIACFLNTVKLRVLF